MGNNSPFSRSSGGNPLTMCRSLAPCAFVSMKYVSITAMMAFSPVRPQPARVGVEQFQDSFIHYSHADAFSGLHHRRDLEGLAVADHVGQRQGAFEGIGIKKGIPADLALIDRPALYGMDKFDGIFDGQDMVGPPGLENFFQNRHQYPPFIGHANAFRAKLIRVSSGMSPDYDTLPAVIISTGTMISIWSF